jgi:hypothetical protein
MPVQPLNRIYETPVVKRGENEELPPRKKPKQKKKEQRKESGKIDIKV